MRRTRLLRALDAEIAQHGDNLRRLEAAVRASSHPSPDNDPAVIALLDELDAHYAATVKGD